MFKIVQTNEKGLNHLVIVPNSWEKNGHLFWPKSNADKLIRNAFSTPSETNWFKLPCKLKRNNLETLEIADEELEIMLENEDTEGSEDATTNTERKKKSVKITSQKGKKNQHKEKAENQIELNETKEIKKRHKKINRYDVEADVFNNIATDCYVIAEEGDSVTTVGPTITTTQVLQNLDPCSTSEVPLASTSNYQNDTFDSLIMANGLIIDVDMRKNIEKIFQNQEMILSNQIIIMKDLKDIKENEIILPNLAQKVADLQTFIETFTVKQMDANKAKTNNIEIEDEIYFQPIDTLEEIENFEKKLQDKNVMKEYLKKFSFICGTNSGNASNNSYMLVDKIFTRKFMTITSWAGGSRDNTKEKIPFKIFKNTLNLFMQIIKMSDPDFTLKNCEDFFKSIIRNSAKRYASNLARSSHKKKRPSNLTYKIRNSILRLPSVHQDSTEALIDEANNDEESSEESDEEDDFL